MSSVATTVYEPAASPEMVKLGAVCEPVLAPVQAILLILPTEMLTFIVPVLPTQAGLFAPKTKGKDVGLIILVVVVTLQPPTKVTVISYVPTAKLAMLVPEPLPVEPTVVFFQM